ncbi:MAG: tRNA (adenosine(37)-N6)-threonylcarbamoyltransferase complex dimerization subunit type 1 TsaB [Prevotellaceae bacterium]|jgi:tRNA threonylcarbamoyladenosine biosynthesis protein TsaB|nr:tRNA (adenosine(37)-N6)-threonylcarbamoyltransferase complex dimerization subunit type 1 TsaB [Prevotellaceae bacterium]
MSGARTPLLLHIETGTAVCSVALSHGDTLLAIKENSEGRAHARLLAVLIDALLREQHCTINDLAAVAVGEGPGSYTGLRVGVSTAKGICYGSRKPLIAVNALQSLAFLAIEKRLLPAPGALIAPMIDARRMEVYTALFDATGQPLTPTGAKIIDENSFADHLSQHHLLFVGDGADKCRALLTHPHAHFASLQASAAGMVKLAAAAFAQQRFADVAYFEPFYLKEFVAIPPKKNP